MLCHLKGTHAMTRCISALALCLSASVISLPAWAGRPLQTEDAGILEAASCEIEGASADTTASDNTDNTTSLQLGCGVGFNTQLALATSRDRMSGESGNGLRLGGKTGLWRGEGDNAPAFTFAYGVGWSKAAEASWLRTGTTINLVYSRAALDHLTLHVNLGHARDEVAGQGTTTWGLALEHAGFGSIAPMAEIFGDERDRWWNFGLRFTAVPEKAFIDFSYGRQINADNARLLTVGFKVAF
jgi:hypothetical protein